MAGASAGVSRHYIFDPAGRVIYETRVGGGSGSNPAAPPDTSYVFAFGQHLAKVAGTIGGNGEVSYYHNDQLGSPMAMTDKTGKVIWSQDYLPYGEDLNENPQGGDTRFKFNGKEQDEATGLYYFNARWYDSELGRFTTEDSVKGDPNDPVTLNYYAYARNNPLIYVDPDGHWAEWIKRAGKAVGLELKDNTWVDKAVSGVAGFIPFVGDAADAAAVVSGVDQVTGEKLSTSDRIVTAAGAILPVSGKFLRNAKDLLGDGAVELVEGLVKKGEKVSDSEKTVKEAGKGVNKGAYEVLSEQPISGNSRSTHRNSANENLLRELENNPTFSGKLNGELGTDVIEHMRSGKGLKNPPGTEWHHPKDSPDTMQLLRKEIHKDPELQDLLHPGGTGGFADFYGDYKLKP